MRLTVFSLCLLLPMSVLAEDKPAEKKDDAKEEKLKTVKAKIKRGDTVVLTLDVPETWKQEQPKSRLRLAQFVIPKSKDDEEDGELALFSFGGGANVQANVDRWIGQFHSDGREVKVSKGKTDDSQYYFVEISGTYNKPIGPPIQRRTEPMPGARMLGVILGRETGIYYFKMTGPDKTIAKERKTLRASFGADIDKEEAVEQEESS